MQNNSEDYRQELLKDSYVIRGGKISKFGTVRILYKGISETQEKNEGLEIWSPVLYGHRKGGYKAAIFDNHLAVLDKKGIWAATIPADQISFIDMAIDFLVREDGWAIYTSSEKSTLAAILNAGKGIKPPFPDNSPFPKVAPELIGAKLIALESDDKIFKMYKKNGEEVKFQLFRPLSFKKRGKRIAKDHL